MAANHAQHILLGIGNPDRGDDGAGRLIARLLRPDVPAGVEVVEHDGEATSLLAHLEGKSVAVIVDACRSGRPTGTVQRFDVSGTPLRCARFGLSTHGFGLEVAIELARSLGQLPPRCIVYAVEALRFDVGTGLSPAVAAAVRNLAPRIVADLSVS